MRAAASKIAGIGSGAVHGVLRGATAVRQSVRNPSSMIFTSSSSEVSSAAADDVAAIQRLTQELGEGELVTAGGRLLPRVVFFGVPDLQEAQEATLALKDGLDRVYLSSPTSDQISSPLVQDHVREAFNLLSTNTEVQNVVASIVSDLGVWSAMLENSELRNFMQSNQIIPMFQEPTSADNSSDQSRYAYWKTWFMGMLRNTKLTVVDLVRKLSSTSEKIFEQFPEASGDGNATNRDQTFKSSFMGLATMVAMVVFLKRI